MHLSLLVLSSVCLRPSKGLSMASNECHIFMNYLSIWESFQGLSFLNGVIYAVISTITLGFSCFKSVYRF